MRDKADCKDASNGRPGFPPFPYPLSPGPVLSFIDLVRNFTIGKLALDICMHLNIEQIQNWRCSIANRDDPLKIAEHRRLLRRR